MCCVFSSVKWSSYTNGTWPAVEKELSHVKALAGCQASGAQLWSQGRLRGHCPHAWPHGVMSHLSSTDIFEQPVPNHSALTPHRSRPRPSTEEDRDEHGVGRRGLADLVISKVLCTSQDQQPPSMAARGNLLIAAGRDPVVAVTTFQVVPKGTA